MGPDGHGQYDAAAWGDTWSWGRVNISSIDSNHNNPAGRQLAWQGCYNVRDLGGLPKRDGQMTRSGVIIRSDMLNRLTAVGRQQFLDHGVRTVIDLRRTEEIEEEPAVDFASLDPDLDYYNLVIEQTMPRLQGTEDRSLVYQLIVDHNAEPVAQIMRTIVLAREGGIVIHCHAGKDRTGIMAAMLLELAGVDRETILDDYHQSQANLWPLYESLVAEAGGEDLSDPWMKPIADPATIDSLLGHFDKEYGGVEQYLKMGGLSDQDLARLKALL